MELNHQLNDKTLNISIEGAMDDSIASNFGATLKSLLETEFDETVFNLYMVPIVTSTIIGIMLSYYKILLKNGRKMRIKGISNDLYELFQSLQLQKIFPIEQ